MYAFYLNDLKSLRVKNFSSNPNSPMYNTPEFSKFEIIDNSWQDFVTRINNEEIIYSNGIMQAMVYTTEVVKYNDNTYAKINNYDFRLEGIDYIKVAEDDAGYLAFKSAEELKNAKRLKIEECKNTFNSIKMVIKDVETKEILDEGTNFQKDPFDELIEFNEFPARYFTSISFVKNEGIYTDYIPLSKDSLRILYNRTKDYIQYKKTNLFDNESRIYKLNTIAEVNNYQFKTGANMDEEVASTFEILVKKETDTFDVAEVQLKNSLQNLIKIKPINN